MLAPLLLGRLAELFQPPGDFHQSIESLRYFVSMFHVLRGQLIRRGVGYPDHVHEGSQRGNRNISPNHSEIGNVRWVSVILEN